MSDECPECGTPVPAGGTCRDNFDSLLAMEANIPEAVGETSHFLAVAAYVLQHPDSMDYSNEGLESLQRALTDHLNGQRTIPELRAHMQNTFDGETRIRAEPDESVANWRRDEWPVTVTDVLTEKPNAGTYQDGVRQWAESVRETLSSPTDRRTL